MKHRRLLAVLLLLLACPVSAQANAGTPLMWAGMLHLAIGNALIGALEGWLLAWLFKVPKNRAMTFMVLANYFSAWVGGLLLRGFIVAKLNLDLNNAWSWFWIMAGVTYLITLLLEWPFIYFVLRGWGHNLRRSLIASLVVQSVSYVLLCGWYWGASVTTLYTRARVVKPGELTLLPEVVVYFIGRDDGDVHQARLNSSETKKVFELDSIDRNDRLLVLTNTLLARLETGDHRHPKLVSLRTNFTARAVPHFERDGRESGPENTWFNFGPVPPLGDASPGDWSYWAGFWAAEGIHCWNKIDKQSISFAYETPFGDWPVRNAVLLPGNQILFQLGRDQICVLDLRTRRVALLWRGRGPLPVIE